MLCRQNNGFTLIELVIVIVLLGILSVFALPKFADLSEDANTSALKGLEGAIRSAGAIVYTKATIQGIQGDATGSVDLDGDGIDDVETEFGYPSDSRTDGMTLALDSGFTTSWAWSTRNAPRRIVISSASTSTSGAGQKVNNVPITTNNCYLTYIAPTSAGDTPSITLTTSGC